MKLTVIINCRGKVAGTFRHDSHAKGMHIKLAPGPEQSVREIEVPDEFARLEPKELHERIVKEYLKGNKPSSPRKISKKN